MVQRIGKINQLSSEFNSISKITDKFIFKSSWSNINFIPGIYIMYLIIVSEKLGMCKLIDYILGEYLILEIISIKMSFIKIIMLLIHG